jgi:hypothetical protein
MIVLTVMSQSALSLEPPPIGSDTNSNLVVVYPEVRQPFLKVYQTIAKGAAEVYDEVQQHSALAKKVHGAFIKGRKEIGAWTNLSDSPYISQRNRALGL